MSDKLVLVVDDDPNLVRSLLFVLGKEGYRVDSAANGEEAIAKIHQYKPHVVFLDIMMPKKNGYEVCQEIKSSPELKDTYVIMLTAKGQEIDRERALELKADEFITKPFSLSEVVKRIRELMG